jgi:hypothetical protein
MTTKYRFVRTKLGITAFAGIELSSIPAPRSQIVWLDAASEGRLHYGDVVERGLRAALDAHEAAGGAPQQVSIHEVVATTADTKPDAVQCAAALGLWKELGRLENTVDVQFVTGAWTVKFLTAS